MAIHYNLTLLHDKLGDNQKKSFSFALDFFVHNISVRLKEVKSLIDDKDRSKLQEILPEVIDYLIDFGVLHAHQDGEDLLKWINGKGKRKEALTLYNSLLAHYRLAKKEIQEDYLAPQTKRF